MSGFLLRPLFSHMRSSGTRIAILPVLLTALILSSCVQHSGHAAQVVEKQSPELLACNDIAHFLAGLKGRPGGFLHDLEDTPSWQKYSAELDEAWKRTQDVQFTGVDAFQKNELAALRPESEFVFYPFSGPDVLYVTRFFPDSRLYVMAGLEPVGNLRDPKDFRKDTLDKELHGWSQSLSSIFDRSFFVTREMDSQFRGRVADGLLPMILLLLARTGNNIDAVQFGHLDPAGQFVKEGPEGDEKHRHKGVEITFRKGSETTTRRMFYFSRDLGPGFETDPAFSQFLLHQGTPATMVKSASFLLHWKMCAGLRKHILENSNFIFQDDTGVPYGYFRPADWQVKLFGQYSRPDRPFTKEYQRDLDQAFQNPANVKTLGFSLGYGYGRRPSSMMIAQRIRPAAAVAAGKQ
jgi:hypothetical protein